MIADIPGGQYHIINKFEPMKKHITFWWKNDAKTLVNLVNIPLTQNCTK